jgi:hypothetical protein
MDVKITWAAVIENNLKKSPGLIETRVTSSLFRVSFRHFPGSSVISFRGRGGVWKI